MPDPRIERTRHHILDVTRRMLTAGHPAGLNFSTLSAEAKVSRRTLYTHWRSIGHVIGDAVVDIQKDEAQPEIPESGDTRIRLKAFMENLRMSISDARTGTAMATLLQQAVHDPQANASLRHLVDVRITQLEPILGPVSYEQYSQIIGPMIFLKFYLKVDISDGFLESLTDEALQVLRESDPAATS